jgi:TolB-like protein/thioredoxin-like negative regulator of GroEL
MNLRQFVTELRHRRVFRVAMVYAVVAFVLVQLADLLVPALLLPDWTFRFVTLLLILGFPVALVLAWAFELTPSGIRRQEPVPPPSLDPSPALSRHSRKVFFAGIGVLVAVGAVLYFLRAGSGPAEPPAPPAGEVVSIAVLPFTNLDPDPGQEYFSDGITVDLITNLSLIEGFQVISRSSAMLYKGTELSIPEIARELGVGYVVGGSVRRDGNQVRINAELLDPARDTHLWAERYDRELTGIFQVQAEIADRIATALAQSLSPEDRARIAEAGTSDPVALDLLHRGQSHLYRPGGRADLGRYEVALDFFHRALEVDPSFARAYVAIAETYRRHVALPAVPLRRDYILEYAGKALELDPELPEALAELGFAHLFRSEDWDRARKLLRRALALDHSQTTAMVGVGRLEALNGSLAEAVRWQRRALEVDPRSAEPLTQLGRYLYDIGDLDGAEKHFRQATSLEPDNPEMSFLLASVLLLRGEEEAADEVMDAMVAAAAGSPGVPSIMAHYLIHRGRRDQAEDLLARSPAARAGAMGMVRALNLRRLGEEQWSGEFIRDAEEMFAAWERDGELVPPRARLLMHLFHGDQEGALATIREHWRSGLSYVEDPPWIGLYWLDQDPFLEALRDDPDFQALMQEIRSGLDRMRGELAG